MSTVVEIKDLYHGILSKYVNKEIIPDIMMYIRIIAKYECETCCNKNCKKLKLEKKNWEPFRVLCNYNDCNRGLTKKLFHILYCGKYDKPADYAKYLLGDEDAGYNSLHWSVKDAINWDKVWINISYDFNVIGDYIFRTV
jgi:hypothetical protein